MPRRNPLSETGSVTFGGWQDTTGSVTSPAAFTIFDTVSVTPGTYTVNWTVTLAGTVGAPEANNFGLVLGSGPTLAAPSVNTGAVGTYPQAPVTFTVTRNDTITIKSWANAATAGAIYGGTIFGAGSGNGTLKMVPWSAKVHWFPTVASVKASTAVSEAQCRIYIGPAPTDPSFVDGTLSGSSGDSTDHVSGYEINATKDPAIWALWTGGDPGAQGTMSIAGTMTIE